jgi:glycosyltransferase involved in cell wall biosynthesis
LGADPHRAPDAAEADRRVARMRVGQNPAKFVEEVPQPAQVTAAVISYVPFLEGYYAQSLDVLRVCLRSLRENADKELDLMVFDNASCAEVREYLLGEQETGRLQYLILSERNIGKGGAWNAIFGAAPGKYIAYADSDVYFYPGWLSPQIKALETFPLAGMVTGMPILTPIQYSLATVEWAEKQKGAALRRGPLISWDDFWFHASSLGDDEERARAFYAENEAHAVSFKGETYYIGSAHFQFVARKEALQSITPIPFTRPMGEVRQLDALINEKGYLRLCTVERYVRHMGNTLPKDMEALAQGDRWVRRKAGRRKGLGGFGPVRRFLQWVHRWSFDVLYRK